jgi:hypothetical protein
VQHPVSRARVVAACRCRRCPVVLAYSTRPPVVTSCQLCVNAMGAPAPMRRCVCVWPRSRVN